MLRFVLMLILFAAVIYFVVRWVQQRGPEAPGPAPRRPLPPRPQGPDDDEDFLRDLDRRRLDPEDPE